jgi:transcriptional regulator with XRE-family HTH domain
MQAQGNMAARNSITTTPPYPVEAALRSLGSNIRTARIRRGLSAHDLGRKIGVGRDTVAEAEKGKPSTAIAVYAGLLWALGMVEQLVAIADPAADEEGRTLAMAREPKRARRAETLDNDF